MVPFLTLNIRKKGTLIIKGSFGNLAQPVAPHRELGSGYPETPKRMGHALAISLSHHLVSRNHVSQNFRQVSGILLDEDSEGLSSFAETWETRFEPQVRGWKSQVLHLGLRAACSQACSQAFQVSGLQIWDCGLQYRSRG